MCQLCVSFSPFVLFCFFCRLRYCTPTSDDSFPREKLRPIHQFKTTRAVTADHKELQRNRSLTEQWRIQGQFLSRGKGFWPQNQNEWTAWKTTKTLRYSPSQTHAKNAVRQYLRIIPHQKCEETLQCQEEKRHTVLQRWYHEVLFMLGLLFCFFLF